MAKILVANKFYYPRGGDCVYAINLVELLQSHGHDVAVFSMQHPGTLSTKWNTFFPSEVQFSLGRRFFNAVLRPFGTKEVKQKYNALLDCFQPDIVHLNNIHTQLSPVIAELAHQRGIKVIWTLHDYKLLCPRYDCLRNGKTVCEDCFVDKTNVLKNRCMKNSLFASYIAYKEAMCWTRERLEACTDAFICPSRFLASKMEKGGFDNLKLHTVCNFIDVDKCRKESYNKENWYCFVGRLSYEKGLKTLINVAGQLPYKLIVIGDGPLKAELENLKYPNVEFVGFKQWKDIKVLVGQARFCVIPSECYENNPFSVIEAQCLGTPVLGARIGGIPDLIKDEQDGLLFESKNPDDLKNKIEEMFNRSFNYKILAEKSQVKYSSEQYYSKLMDLYTKVLR